VSRATYTDADKARVYVVLMTNEGNIKRTSRETDTPENTVRRWKREWEQNGPPELNEVEEAVVDYAVSMERTRDLALKRIHQRLSSEDEKKWGTLPQLATVFGVLTDKIDRARGIADRRVEHRHVLPSPDELRAAMDALVSGAQQHHELREEDIIEAEIEQAALPAGTRA
jgi:transposase-like protein